MLILEYATTEAAALRREAAGCASSAEIYLRDGGNGALIVYEGTKPPNSSTVKEVRILFDGGRYGQDGGDWMFCVGLWTPEDFREEFLAWYRIEHLPMLLECPVWNGCRFAEENIQNGCQFYAMHQLSDKKALDSDERKRSRSTPWFKRLSKNDWFDGGFVRTLYKRLS